MEETALFIIEQLNNNGFDAYIVGGAVRNKLLNLPIKDYDLTTNASPEIVKRIFADKKLVLTGLKHGTVGVIFDNAVYEITTYRTDGIYTNHRCPETVKFVTSLKDDLMRRDFTINALAYGADREVIDYFGGIQDIKNNIIRTVGDPIKRFTEDALRILRAIRFASVYGFKIEKRTLEGMLACKKFLKNISSERIYSEMTAILCGEFVADAIYTCKEVIFEIFPELAISDGFLQYSNSHDYDVFNHTLKALKLCKNKKPSIMWALLFHDSGKPSCFSLDEKGYGHTYGHMDASAKIAEVIMNRLKFPNKLKHDIIVMILHHDETICETKYQLKKFMSIYGKDLTYDLMDMKFADTFAHSTHGIKKYTVFTTALRDMLLEIEANKEIFDIKQLDISGDDLIALGATGKNVGEIKTLLFDAVLRDQITNNKNCLIEFAKKII